MGVGSFADAIDALLYENARFAAVAIALFGAHLVIGGFAIARRISRPMAGLNLAVAAVVLLYKASQYAAYPALVAIARDDWASNTDVRLIAFEAVVAIVAGFALAGWRLAVALSAAAFVAHTLAAAAATIFALTFSLDRLF